ncbi:BamA/TamA family outer membrane protein [Thiolapillus sp.]|nr:BamA/TamA family outer membrane protein [Thiolapillus sp.]
MDYYGFNGGLGKHPVRFESTAFGLMQELQFRLGESHFFAGISYRLVDTQNKFDLGSVLPIPGIPALKFDSRSAGVSLSLNYDDRDNMFTPSDGLYAELKLGNYGSAWGGDDNFNKYRLYAKYYQRLSDDWVMGLRGDTEGVDGDAPFYEYPFVDMRGIKVMRYQGKRTALGELELRWSFHPRWALVGFSGVGKTWAGNGKHDSDALYSKGLGFRYLIASKLGLQVGVDIAQGPEDAAFYIQVGSAWKR